MTETKKIAATATGDAVDGSSDGQRWVLSFRVHHPCADLAAVAERIGEAFGADRRVLWREGEPVIGGSG